jgi:aquaporin Z
VIFIAETKMIKALRNHWLEYFCEAFGLGIFMVSACVFSVILFHPNSAVIDWNMQLRLVLIGLAMGLTAIAIFKSPFGKFSGAHINPAVTLTFWRLGKIRFWDAVFYVLFQFIGAIIGVWFSWLILGNWLENKEVNFAITIPNQEGWIISFIAEFIISFGMMTMVLITSNHAKLSRYTPYFAGFLVAVYISLEAPVSGMSMNPARSFGSAIIANFWTNLWIYFVAPPIAMLLAGEVFLRLKGVHSILCAKFDHYGNFRCIFNCRFSELAKKEDFIEVTKQKAMFPPVTGIF